MAEVICKWCGEQLDVGTESRSIVALCMNGPMLKGQNGQPVGRAISQCDVKLWGSPGTRFQFGDEREPSHVIQTNPPELSGGKNA